MKLANDRLWNKFKKRLVKTIKDASQKSEKFSKQSKVKINELGIKKEVEEKLLDLGGHVYEKAKRTNNLNFEQDLLLKHLIEQIKELEKELKQLETIQRGK